MPFAMQLFLGAESNVVHSYAAICIEKLLLLKDEGGRSSQVVRNPTFNHYIFESVAVLVRRACECDISLITEFDSSLFPRLKMILADDVREFIPYAFQLLAQLVELNIQPISPDYMEMFLLLLAPNPNWWRILQKAPHEVTQKNLLGVFDKLVKTPSTVEQGCYVLNTVIEYMEYGVIAPYMTFVWSSLFTNLQQKKSVELQKCLVIFISLFLVKHGPANLVDTMNAVQRNIFIAILPRQDSYVRLQPFSIQQLLMSLVSRPEQERAIDEPEMPEISDNTATFVNLYNVGRRQVDPLEDITDPKQFFVTSLAMLSASHPGRYPWVIRYNLEKANQDALIKLCTAYNCAIV
ncbi:unnamed protein product [Brassica rapa subsp. trilocularis]